MVNIDTKIPYCMTMVEVAHQETVSVIFKREFINVSSNVGKGV